MRLSWPARVYLFAVVAAACAVLGTVVFLAFIVPPAHRVPWLLGDRESEDLRVAAELLLLSIVAQTFHVPITPNRKVSVTDAVFYAVILLFGPALAILLVASSKFLGQLLIVVYHRATRRTWRSLLFNTGQYVIAAFLASLVYQFLPQPWSIVLTAATMYLTTTWAVAVMAGLHNRVSPIQLWRVGWTRIVSHQAGGYLIGWITARTSAHDYWLPLAMAVPTAIIYISLKRHVQLVEQTVGAVESLADIVDRRDPYTFQHSKRVAEYAVKVARALKLPSEDVDTIRLAARVHDVGKIGVPDAVLFKPGKLTDEEWAQMRQHPEIGYEILSRFPEYGTGRELVRSHHEHWNGSGYPLGLPGNRIPLGAQIIAVSDTFDAMTSDRPYRKALPVEVAMAELRRHKDAQWPAFVVDALERALGVAGETTSQSGQNGQPGQNGAAATSTPAPATAPVPATSAS